MLQSVQVSGLETRKNLGIFWPLEQWNGAYPDMPPHPKDITNLEEEGNKVKGVVRDKKYGEPIGTTDLSYVRSKLANLVTDVARSDEAVADGEVEVAYKVVQRQAAVSSRTVNTGTHEKPVESVHFVTAKKRKKDEDDLLAELWEGGGLFLNLAEDDEKKQGSGGGTKKRSRQALLVRRMAPELRGHNLIRPRRCRSSRRRSAPRSKSCSGASNCCGRSKTRRRSRTSRKRICRQIWTRLVGVCGLVSCLLAIGMVPFVRDFRRFASGLGPDAFNMRC